MSNNIFFNKMQKKARQIITKKERRRLLKNRTVRIMRPRVFDAVIATNPYAFIGIV